MFKGPIPEIERVRFRPDIADIEPANIKAQKLAEYFRQNFYSYIYEIIWSPIFSACHVLLLSGGFIMCLSITFRRSL